MMLTSRPTMNNTVRALAKSNVGIATPFNSEANGTSLLESVFFCGRDFTSTTAFLLTLNKIHTFMVGCSGRLMLGRSLSTVVATRSVRHPSEIATSCVAVIPTTQEASNA